MNVSNAVKNAYKNNSAAKILSISFPSLNYTVPQNEVYYESMELEESIFDGDSFEAIGCIASKFSISIRNSGRNLKGQKIVVTISLSGIANSDIPLFTGYVDIVDKEAQKKMQKITAYDELYSKGSTEVATWYKNLTFPITLKNFRNSLFSYIGITQKSTTLPTDNISINKEYSPNTMSAIDVIKALCQINGCFGIINRDGKFEYRYIDMSGSVETVSYYRSMDYKDYSISPVDKLIIRQNKDDSGITYGSGTTQYIIQGNMFTYNLSTSRIGNIAESIYPHLHSIEYIPFEASNNGYPWIEVGDNCKVKYSVYDFANSTPSESVYDDITVIVFKRSMKGIQNLVDTYEAEGKEMQQEFISDISQELEILQQTIDNLVKNMSTEITTYRNASTITIADGRTATIADMVYEANRGNTIIFHEEADLRPVATETMSSHTYTIGDVVGTVKYYVNGTRLQTHLSEEVLTEGKHILSLTQFWQAGTQTTNRVQVKLTAKGGSIKIPRLRAQAYITVKQSDYVDAAIEVTTMPDKTVYSIGETLDFTGLVISKVYFDDSVAPEDVTEHCVFSPAEGSTVTSTDIIEVLVTYTETTEIGETITYDTTFQLSTSYLISITVEQDPDKVEYYIGESLDLTGIVISADYSDGTSANVTESCVFSPQNGTLFTKTNQGRINISYTEGGITATTSTYVTVQVSPVLEVIGIEITNPPTRTMYYVGDTFDSSGIVVSALWSDGTKEEINDYTLSPANGSQVTEGTSMLTATYTYEASGRTFTASCGLAVIYLPYPLLKYLYYTMFDDTRIIEVTGVKTEEVVADNLQLLYIPKTYVHEGVTFTMRLR